MAKEKPTPCFLLALNAQSTKEKVKISPIGLVTGVDGRVYQINADDIVKRMTEQKIDIVLNVNHAMDAYGEKAAGWFDINSMEVRENGIYATLTPTDIGETLIKEKHFRYLSPEYHISWNGDIREVHDIGAVGLVNRPNVLDEALNKQKEAEEEIVPKDTTVEELQTQLNTANERNAQLEQNAKIQKVDMAIASGHLLPADKDFAIALNDQHLDAYLSREKAKLAHLGNDVKPDAHTEDNTQISDEQKAVDAQLGLGA